MYCFGFDLENIDDVGNDVVVVEFFQISIVIDCVFQNFVVYVCFFLGFDGGGLGECFFFYWLVFGDDLVVVVMGGYDEYFDFWFVVFVVEVECCCLLVE